jgi:hypothetical protein
MYDHMGSNTTYYEGPEQWHNPLDTAPADVFMHVLPKLGYDATDKKDQDWMKNGRFEAFDQ